MGAEATIYADLWSPDGYGLPAEGGVPYHIVLVDKADLFFMGDAPSLDLRTTERRGAPWPVGE